MDMHVRATSRYYSPDIKRKGILERSAVEIGYEFILRLVSRRSALQEFRPVSKEDRAKRFKRDKNVIAQEMGYDLYVSLPKDAKAFESRCSSIQKHARHMKFSDIAREEKLLNEKLCEDLHASIMEEICYHVPKIPEEERVHRLMRRMCNYSIPYRF